MTRKSTAFFYTAPSDKIFDEVKGHIMAIWIMRYEDISINKKEKELEKLENIRDNFMYMVGRLDEHNQLLLSSMCSKEAEKEVGDRLKAGGTPDRYNLFISQK